MRTRDGNVPEFTPTYIMNEYFIQGYNCSHTPYPQCNRISDNGEKVAQNNYLMYIKTLQESLATNMEATYW